MYSLVNKQSFAAGGAAYDMVDSQFSRIAGLS
jgi:hypothetical protein